MHDQDVVWQKGYGFADLAKKSPATPATAYRIASLSKLFTATAILQLRDAGRLQLDDPVAKWLPEFRPAAKFPDAPVITIRHLLTHTSGLPRELSGAYWNDMKFPDTAAMLRELNEAGPAVPRRPSTSTRTSRSRSPATSSRRFPASPTPCTSRSTYSVLSA